MKYIYCIIHLYIQSTPDKSDSQGNGKSVRLSKMSDLARCPTYPRFRITCKYDMR